MLKVLLMVSIYVAFSLYVLSQTLFYSYRIFGAGKGDPKLSIAFRGGHMNLPMKIETLLFCLFSFLPVLGTFLSDMPGKYLIMKCGNIWFGFLIFFGGFLFLAHMARLIANRRRVSTLTLRWNASILVLCFVFAVALEIYGSVHALHTKAIYYDIDLTNNISEEQIGQSAVAEDAQSENEDDKNTAGDTDATDTGLDSSGFSVSGSMRIVLAGDLHMSVNSKPKAIKNMVDRINEQNADVVIIAGDFFTSNYDGLEDPEKYIAELKRIKSKYGVYAVYGNHDVTENLFFGFSVSPVKNAFRDDRMTEFLEKAGITMLEDEVTELPNGVQIAGRIDGDKAGDGTANRMSEQELLSGCDPDKPILVLEHEPDEYEALSEAGADIVASGHTHDGQIFPANIITSLLEENSFGEKKLYGMETVVTAGVGFFGPPMRLGTDSDISVIDLKF